jgi:hypothetical protein
VHPKNRSHTETLFDRAKASAALLPPDEAARWVERLDELHNECGCAVGARFFFTALVGYPAVWYWLLRPSLPSPLYAALVGVGVIFFAAGLGKLTGILLARRRLRLAVGSLQARVAEQSGEVCAQLS